MVKKTRLQYAVEYISNHKKACKFSDILDYVKVKLELSDADVLNIIGDLFMELTDEPSVVNVGDNKWALRDKFKYEELNPEEDEEPEEENNGDDEEEEEGADFTMEDENTDTSNHDAVENEENQEEEM